MLLEAAGKVVSVGEAEIIADEIILAEKLLNNDTDIAEYDSPERFPDSVKIYQHNNAKMLYQK